MASNKEISPQNYQEKLYSFLSTLKVESRTNEIEKCEIKWLHLACEYGLFIECEKLIQLGFDIDSQDELSRTPILIASQTGDYEIVSLLLQAGANVNLMNEYGCTPLLCCTKNGNLVLFKKLLENTNEILCETILGTISPLALAALFGKYEIVNFLVENYPELVNEPIKNTGMTPLMLGVIGNHLSIVKTFLFLDNSRSYKTIRNASNKSAYDLANLCEDPEIRFLFSPVQSCPSIFIFPPPHEYCEENQQKTKSKIPRKILTPTFHVFSPLSPKLEIEFEHVKMGEEEVVQAKPKRKRSKSASSISGNKKRNSETEQDLLEKILKYSNLTDCMDILIKEEIDLKVFLTMNRDDLISIGFTNTSTLQKLLQVIHKYRRIFV